MAHNPDRLVRVRQGMKDKGLVALYVRNLSNISWITGFEKVFDTEPAHALLITQKRVLMHSDSRYGEALEREARGSEIVIDTERNDHTHWLFKQVERLFDEAERRDQRVDLGDCEVFTIGIETTLSLAEYRSLEKCAGAKHDGVATSFVELSDFIEGLRQTKDAFEIAAIKKAQAITDEAFARIIKFMKVGMTEREVQLQLDNYLFELGAEGLAFDTIVASGAYASSPHAIPGDTKLSAGDAVVMDFGAKLAGYCSDMTRTVFMSKPSELAQKAWDTLRGVNESCEAMIRAGVGANEVHEHAEELLAQGGFAGRMGHALGHSVGLDIHESPTLSPRNKKPLCAGNVVTVEPGIYIPGQFGMRLEDFGVVTNTGYNVFTQSTHNMVIIDD